MSNARCDAGGRPPVASPCIASRLVKSRCGGMPWTTLGARASCPPRYEAGKMPALPGGLLTNLVYRIENAEGEQWALYNGARQEVVIGSVCGSGAMDRSYRPDASRMIPGTRLCMERRRRGAWSGPTHGAAA